MAKVKLGTSKVDTQFGRELIAATKEALAHSKGKIALPTFITEREVKSTKRALIKTS